MGDPAVTADGVYRRFGDVEALTGLDLEIARGTVFGLLGPNGAGKTTAVRIFTTILHPDAGTARVLGHDVVADADAVRRNIGLAGQYAAVDENLTGSENLRLVGRLTHLGGHLARKRADELLERFELTDAANRPVRTYSGGMRRRLDLAASLVHRPPVLFLDEPTTGLDPASRKELWRIIEELVASGSTLLLTTQYLEEADRLADRIAVIDHGRVIAEGTSSQLKADLGATVLELGFADETAAVRAVELLDRSSPHRDHAQIEVSLEDGARAVIDILRVLDHSGLEPEHLALREPSLDDVFLTLTGHRAGGDDPPAATGPEAHADGGQPSEVDRS